MPREGQHELGQAWSLQKSQLSPHVQLCNSFWEGEVLVCPSVCFGEGGSYSLLILPLSARRTPLNMKIWGRSTQGLS